jgi:hypothetical protein
MDGYEMSTFGHRVGGVHHTIGRGLLVLLAVSSLAISVVSRFSTTPNADFGKRTSISAQSANAKTQHLLSDGAQWTAPVASFIMLVVPRGKRRIYHPILPLIYLHSENWLYNRPPPFC